MVLASIKEAVLSHFIWHFCVHNLKDFPGIGQNREVGHIAMYPNGCAMGAPASPLGSVAGNANV